MHITRLTSNCHHSLRLLASNKKDHVPLRRVDIVVLEEEELVHAIFLQCRGLHQQVDRSCERFFEHEILLASDLGRVSAREASSDDDITLHPQAAGAAPAEPFRKSPQR